jgi:hypothetical protein
MNCVLDNGVRILARSRGQKIRGLKHRQHRPALIVADDVEDLDWVRTQENRDKSDRWFRGNVLPSLDEQHGRCVIIGNWLHTDGLMARLKNTGIFKVLEFSLLREGDGTEIERCTWKATHLRGDGALAARRLQTAARHNPERVACGTPQRGADLNQDLGR